MLFINSESLEERYGVSYTNSGECELMVDLLKHLRSIGVDLNRFGFVSPYAGQTNLMRQRVKELQLEENVRTIDSWQGREVDCMILSAVRSNPRSSVGFIDNQRRINVALTRAKHGLIIIGNARTLSTDEKWGLLVKLF